MDALYDQIGKHYDETRKPDPYLVGRLVYLLNPQQGASYLDAGCGTGNYTIALFRKGIRITGLDISRHMLETARKKEPGINWVQASVENAPFKTASFAGGIATLTIHHWQNMKQSLKELARVLGGGNLVIFTSLPSQMEGYWLNRYFPEMMARAGAQMPAREVLEEAFQFAGLKITAEEKYFVRPDLKDLFLYSGKFDPQAYLDPTRRTGISSFQKLCPEEELQSGLLKLKEDYRSGHIAKIMDQYQNDLGDYLFLKLKAPKSA